MQNYQPKYPSWHSDFDIVLVLAACLFAPLMAIGQGLSPCASGALQIEQGRANRGKVGMRCLDNSDQCPGGPAKFYLTQTKVIQWDDNNPYYGCCIDPDPSAQTYSYNETDTYPKPGNDPSDDGCGSGTTLSQTISGSYSVNITPTCSDDEPGYSYSANYDASSSSWKDSDGSVGDPWSVDRYNNEHSGIQYLPGWTQTTLTCTSLIITETNSDYGTGTSTTTLSDLYATSDLTSEASGLAKGRAPTGPDGFVNGNPQISYHITPDEACVTAIETPSWQVVITGAEPGKSYDIRWTVVKQHANGKTEQTTMQKTATAGSSDPWIWAGPAIPPPSWPSGNCYTTGTGTESITYQDVKVAPSAN